METFTLETPGKVNLFLKVMGRRPDSYHEIETLFFPMERITDSVSVVFTEQPGTRISCRTSGVPSDESNICWKAAELYLKTAGIETGMEIFLDKRIPVAAGMGGGSSTPAVSGSPTELTAAKFEGHALIRDNGINELFTEMLSKSKFFKFNPQTETFTSVIDGTMASSFNVSTFSLTSSLQEAYKRDK